MKERKKEVFLLEEDGDFCFQLHDKMFFMLQLKSPFEVFKAGWMGQPDLVKSALAYGRRVWN